MASRVMEELYRGQERVIVVRAGGKGVR